MCRGCGAGTATQHTLLNSNQLAEGHVARGADQRVSSPQEGVLPCRHLRGVRGLGAGDERGAVDVFLVVEKVDVAAVMVDGVFLEQFVVYLHGTGKGVRTVSGRGDQRGTVRRGKRGCRQRKVNMWAGYGEEGHQRTGGGEQGQGLLAPARWASTALDQSSVPPRAERRCTMMLLIRSATRVRAPSFVFRFTRWHRLVSRWSKSQRLEQKKQHAL